MARTGVRTTVGRVLGFHGPEDAAGFLMSLIGAILLLVLYRAVSKRA